MRQYRLWIKALLQQSQVSACRNHKSFKVMAHFFSRMLICSGIQSWQAMDVSKAQVEGLMQGLDLRRLLRAK
jgi:hypothetical protein